MVHSDNNKGMNSFVCKCLNWLSSHLGIYPFMFTLVNAIENMFGVNLEIVSLVKMICLPVIIRGDYHIIIFIS